MATYFEYAKEEIRMLAQAGHFSDSLNAKILSGNYELRPADLVVKQFINGASSTHNLLEGEQKKVPGVNDLDGGYRLNQNRGFFAPRLRVDTGNAADDSVNVADSVFGGINLPVINESKLMITTGEDKLVYDRTITAVTQGVSTDDRKSTQAFAVLDKPIVLVDDSDQGFALKFAPGTSVEVKAAGKNRAIAIRLDGFEIIGK